MDIGIVGAGASGAAAAHALADHDVTVFEKSRGVCGRAATRRRDDCTYDYGANYVKSADPVVNDLLTGTLDSEGLVDVAAPIYTFDADGRVSEGRDADDHKWTYTEGLTQIAKRLFARAGTDVRRETRVGSLSRAGDGWRIHREDDTDLGRFDAVLLTPPAPQTADLLGRSEGADDARTALADAAAAVPYRTVYACLLHYPFELDRPWYGLVNTDREHDCGWLSREELKPGHVPDGESLLVAQMGPDWSERRYDDDPDAVCGDAAAVVAELLDDDRLADPDWTDHQGWKYALPEAGLDGDTRPGAEAHDLYVAGDWVAGEGRVHAALRSGLEAADRVQST
ncbi:NAD(P)/FAD-dependent oxidoreductase [Halorarius halobius]|uniref:NAD(P)/FAD-dependent oxidoreductase n=1 Tax=Halorarius halobius TaxID=2962671 RepID=UPI0020CC007E|nr:FAD-dependent oxidoreductase [Halorarius halobius]